MWDENTYPVQNFNSATFEFENIKVILHHSLQLI